MPIVNHTVESTLQPNGSRNVTLRMYDQDAQQYMLAFSIVAGTDLDGLVSMHIAGLDVQLANAEFEALIGAA